VVIIGAGYIGIEVAENLIEMGKTVHLIQRSNQVLSVYDKMYADMAEAALINAGVKIHKEETVMGYTGDDHVQSVLTKSHEYPADCVVESVGVKPNTDFLKDSGIKMLDNGAIIVNDKGETNLTDVYAAGDCVA
jgi:pyruvate/2-oxoglutarate dehydrogenase complex dihydrolipoamide dehydrogenase (E3) component